MGIAVGDTVFNTQGKPGVVVAKDQVTGDLEVEVGTKKFESTRKRGYINGMSPQEKNTFNEILDRVRKKASPSDRLDLLTEEISKLRKNPKNGAVANYLEGEKAHLMHSEGIQSRRYQTNERNLR